MTGLATTDLSGRSVHGWRSAWHLLLTVACLLLGTACQAEVRDHITERAWLEDTDGNLGWPEVTQRPATVFEGVLSRGFGANVLWLRLRIDPHAHPRGVREQDQLILRIRPVYLDDIQVYDPLGSFNGLAGSTGDRHHPSSQALEGLDFMLPLARGDAPRDVWLRLQTTSTRQIAVAALNYDDLRRNAQTQQLLFALYIGVILVFMVWGLVYWIFSRERVIGAFTAKQASALVYAFISLGYTRVYWPMEWPGLWLDALTSAFSCLAVSAAIYFHVVLIREYMPRRPMVWVHHGLLALLPIKLLLLLGGSEQTRWALQINMTEVLLVPPIFWLSALQAQGWNSPVTQSRPLLAKSVIVGFYSVLLLLMLLAALPGLGLTQGGEIPLYVVQAHGLLTAFLILLMLQYRAHAQQKQQAEIALALERAKLQAQQERNVREEQEKLLTMLAHELKTPLATMQMRLDTQAPGSREIRSAIRDMRNVLDRCVQTTQLGDRRLQAHISRVNLVDLVKDAVSSCPQPNRVQMQLPSSLNADTDRQLLFIVLSNLLENACKYAEPASPIELVLSASQEWVQLAVSNSAGPTGSPDPSKVFDKYYRGPQARRQAGTGLGLYLARKLMDVLGGSIVYRAEGNRVSFVLQLPTAHQPV